MFVLVLSAEADETRQTMMMLIGSLIGIAVLLALLTVWYWFHTDPKRGPAARVGASVVDRATLADDEDDGALIDDSPMASWTSGSAPLVPSATLMSGPVPGQPVPAASASVVSIEGDRPDGEVADMGELTERQVQRRPEPEPARQTWDFVAAARRAEEEGVRIRRPDRPAAPRIRVSGRAGDDSDDADDGDELAVIRRRREREAARGLSDDAWESVRRSVFDKLDG